MFRFTYTTFVLYTEIQMSSFSLATPVHDYYCDAPRLTRSYFMQFPIHDTYVYFWLYDQG